MNKPAGMLDAVVIIPSLSTDFASMSSLPGSNFIWRKTAAVDGKVGFSALAESAAVFQNPASGTGFGATGRIGFKSDVVSATTFAKLEDGGAAVNVGIMTSIVGDYYRSVQRARGDTVIVNLVVWEGLVRDTYRLFNVAVVAKVISIRK